MKYKDKYYKMRYIKAIYIGLIGMLLAGCQADQWESIEGGFQITLSDEVTVTTKSTPAELGEPTTDKFKLKIVNEATNNAAYDGAYKSGTIPAAAGTYTITASFGENPVLALDDPYYKGEETGVVVKDGETTSVNISCSVANALATIFYADTAKFDEMYSSYGVEVKVNNYNYNYSVTIGDGTKKSAYYQAGSKPTFTFKGVLKGNNKEVSKILEDDLLSSASTFEARKHCKLTLSMEATASGLVPTISKAEATTVTINETIPMEWLPAPKVSATGFDENKTLTIYETVAPDAASIDFEVAQPLQDLSFTLNFEDEQFTSLNKDYQLSTMTDEEKIALSDAGITLPLIGSNEPKITFSQAFNARLLSKNDGVVNNTITINSVQANDRENKDEAPLTYTIAVHKPEFTVNVLEGNIWSKTFTAEEISVSEGKGNLETIKKNLVYQYQEADGIWQDFGNQDARQQVFAEHPQNRNYKVRALYRNVLASNEVDVELESQDQLQNSGMEDWYIETKKKSGTWPFEDKTYYTFHPYTTGAANSSWWDTNNDKAQGGTYALGIWYEGCFASCVSYTEDAHSGSKAALMYLSGCGDGKANTSGTYVGGAMVGSLFIGSYNGGIVQGHDFGVRPTALTFWYKYKPYNSDAFKVVISLKNGEKEIATGTYEPTAYSSEDIEYQQASVNFNYSVENEKATTICVQFLASNKTDLSKNDFNMGTTITYPVIGNWTVHMGSILKIDDISLVYDK